MGVSEICSLFNASRQLLEVPIRRKSSNNPQRENTVSLAGRGENRAGQQKTKASLAQWEKSCKTQSWTQDKIGEGLLTTPRQPSRLGVREPLHSAKAKALFETNFTKDVLHLKLQTALLFHNNPSVNKKGTPCFFYSSEGKISRLRKRKNIWNKKEQTLLADLLPRQTRTAPFLLRPPVTSGRRQYLFLWRLKKMRIKI